MDEATNLKSDDEVILEVEGTQLVCNKRDLRNNSDYFKAMFDGSFAERTKRVIKIEGVDLRAMNVLLCLLWDESYFIQSEDLLLVLQAACMLQFDKIKHLCIERVTEALSPDNCLTIWLATEQLDLSPLWLKAKTMAFEEFTHVKDLDCVNDLNLKQLFPYLANRNLNCENEMDVFQICMKWWYENSKFYLNNADEILFTLLTCVDYNSVSDSEIKEMQTYPDIKSSEEIVAVLDCLLYLRNNDIIIHNDSVTKKAKILMQSLARTYLEYPCFTLNNVSNVADSPLLSSKAAEKALEVLSCNLYSGEVKHTYPFIQNTPKLYPVMEEYPTLTVVYYDMCESQIKTFFKIPKQKCAELDGFGLVGYKEFIFLFGGEFLIGKGNWNKNFWVYDTIRERWERKCVMPCKRRHFESCLCGNYLYIIGGTGDFRVIQDNMFWYNYKEDKWSNQIVLPCSGRQIKCCEYKKQLFLLNMNNKCGYLFNVNDSIWLKLDICDSDNVVPKFSEKCAVFSYKNSIFIKADNLIELKVVNNKLAVVSFKVLKAINTDQMEYVLCNKMIFTLYIEKVDNDPSGDGRRKRLILEKFCLDTHTISNVYEKVTAIPTKLHLFKFHHHDLASVDYYVTTHKM